MATVKYSGPVASFHCPTEATIRSLKVHFSPKQLGEGTPSPENVREIEGWDGVQVEQRGKNIWDEEWENGYLNTTTGLNSPTNNQIRTKNYIPLLPNTTYTVKALSKGTIWACFFDSDKTIIKDYAPSNLNRSANVYAISGKTFTTSDNCAYMRFYFTEAYGTTYNKDVMIVIGSIATAYEPYHGSTTNYEFGVLGKNKFDQENEVADVYVDTNGDLIPYTASSWKASDYIKVSSNTIYTFNPGSYDGSLAKHCYYDKDKNFISYIDSGLQTFMTPNNAEYMRFSYRGSDTPMLELGSIATAYEPYDPKHTVYGGWIDLVSGEVCEEWHKIIADGVNVKANSAYNQPDYNRFGAGIVYCSPIGISYNNTEKPVKCDILPVNPNGYGSLADIDQLYAPWAGQLYVVFYVGKISEHPEITTPDQRKEFTNTWLQEHPATILYKLRTPETYHISSTQLQTFLGHNNVWSNADYVEVEYDLHETQDILTRKQFIIANQPHIVKPAAASLQNFVTDMAAPLKECKVYFGPVQEGTGDPSPENVRPISGWTGLRVFQAGKNLMSDNHVLVGAQIKNVDSNYEIATANVYNVLSIDVPKNTALHIHKEMLVGSDLGLGTKIAEYGLQVNRIGSMTNYYNRDFSTGDYSYAYLMSGKTVTIDDPDIKWQIEVGNTATAYEVPKGTTEIPITFPSEVGMVYGGYVDLATGKIYNQFNCVDMSTLSWNYTNGRFYASISDALIGSDNNYLSSAVCDIYPTVTYNDIIRNGVKGIAINNTAYIRVYDNYSTIEDFTSAINGHMLVYPLAVPILLATLTPTQLKTLRGTNNIWSNANGNIELSYWKH